MPVTHYENFPVASWLCPAHLRAPIAALYHFARTADDLADEGSVSPEQRLADLRAYRSHLHRALAGDGSGLPDSVPAAWRGVLQALARQHAVWQWPLSLLDDLLDAFEQDVVWTQAQRHYPDRPTLLDYCRRSANPVGRLVLHLHGVQDAPALQQSDDICTALQLINFWQDLRQDIPRGRHYLTDADCLQHGVSRAELQALQSAPATQALIQAQLDWAEALMRRGAPLVHRLPGRAGWELRLVVQGGLQVIRRLRPPQADPLQRRLKLRRSDYARMLWHSLWM
nr:squalene synthase HpnC [Curvibacter sp. HBC61]